MNPKLQKCWFYIRVDGRLQKKYFNTPQGAVLNLVSNMMVQPPKPNTITDVYWAHNTKRACQVAYNRFGHIVVFGFPPPNNPGMCELPAPEPGELFTAEELS